MMTDTLCAAPGDARGIFTELTTFVDINAASADWPIIDAGGTTGRSPDAQGESSPAPVEAAPTEVRSSLPTAMAGQAAPSEQRTPATANAPSRTPPRTSAAGRPPQRWRRLLLPAGAALGLTVGGYLLVPWVVTALSTISTDDAYVNGHVTFVAARVPGQVARVLVDDNYRVRKGDLLVELDKEPYQVQVAIKQAAVNAAKADLVAAWAQVRGVEAQARSQRFKLQHTIEAVDNQIALLRAKVADLQAKKAVLVQAQADFRRAQELLPEKALSRADYDRFQAALLVAEAQVKVSQEEVYEVRAALGLPPNPPLGKDLAHVPADLDQTFSAVLQAQADVINSAAQFGYSPSSYSLTPKQMIDEFYTRNSGGDIDRILARLASEAPAVKQAEAKLAQAQRDLDQAELNLRYCDVVSEIDGVVTGRNINPGNNVQAGQSLMAVRSVTEIWIDANFKETQLADLRIGQRVRCEVDMYGRRREFEGRITGFTMGTGQTLALLPPQNATGNFVKIVQRLPVRIELTDYDPDKQPLFVGLSVTPYVYYKEPPKGPHAGDVLQALAQLPQAPTEPKP
jgi:membrane fusion protein (multidrug efflux system)